MSSTEPEVPPPIQTNTAMGSCALLNEFFEQVPEAIVLVDGDGRVVRANRKFVHMFRYAPEEIIGASFSTLIAPAELCDGSDRVTGSSSSANKGCSDSVCVRKGGRRFSVSMLEGPLSISSQSAFKYIVCREICDREETGEIPAKHRPEGLEYVFQERDRHRHEAHCEEISHSYCPKHEAS